MMTISIDRKVLLTAAEATVLSWLSDVDGLFALLLLR
jgi:hypothetical protein